jgi:hypothetical protein
MEGFHEIQQPPMQSEIRRRGTYRLRNCVDGLVLRPGRHDVAFSTITLVTEISHGLVRLRF